MNFKQFERRICFKTQTKYLNIALYYIKIDATQMLRNFFFCSRGKKAKPRIAGLRKVSYVIQMLQE